MATIRLIPSTYAVSSTSYLSVTNPTNAYANTDSTNYATITNTYASTSSRYYYLRGFNFGDIPSNAVINSFTVKIKGYESGLSTSTSYAPRLANGTSTLSNTTATTNFGTSTKTITIPTGALTWQQIINYGSSFTIMVYVRRANRNTTGYFYCYGAEILVDYTVPVYHNVSVTNNSSVATVSPTGQQSVLEDERFVVTISGVDDRSKITVTDNGTDVTSQLVSGSSQRLRADLNPAKFVSSSTTVTDQNNACTGTDSTTYARMPIGRQTQNHMIYAFDTSSIPSNATIDSVSCVVKVSTNNSSNITTKTVQLYSVSSAKGSSSTIPTTTGGTVTLTPGTWTRQELEEIQIRFDGYYGGSSSTYYIDFYGADLTINYSISGTVYTYTIQVSSDHDIVVKDSQIIYYKSNSGWVQCSGVYVKENGSWVKQTDIRDLFKDYTIYVNAGATHNKQD